MIKQCYVIKFLANEAELALEIHWRLKEHYEDDAMSRSEVYRWIRDIKCGRNDLKTIPSPRRTTSEVILCTIEDDPHLSAPKIAHSLGTATSTVRHHHFVMCLE
jgi:hypothetical protein